MYATSTVFGKTIGGDIRDNKKTYLYLKALEDADAEQKKTLEDLFAVPTTDFELKYKIVRGIYDDLKIKEYTENQIKRYLDLAIADLEKVHIAEEKKFAFYDLVNQQVDRKK